VWQPTSDPQPLFQNVGSPGQRLCISEASENEGLFVYQNIYVGGKRTRVAVFQTASPRTRSSVFHPIAQGTGSVGFGGVNYTEITDPDVPGWTQSSADPGTQSIKVVDGTGAPTISIMPTLEQPVGGSFAYRGTEAAAVASATCYNENHRGAGAEGGPVRFAPPRPTPICSRAVAYLPPLPACRSGCRASSRARSTSGWAGATSTRARNSRATT
jgi:hypothetical protein